MLSRGYFVVLDSMSDAKRSNAACDRLKNAFTSEASERGIKWKSNPVIVTPKV